MKTKLTVALSLFAVVAAAYVVPNWKKPQRTLAWDYSLADQTNIVSFKVYWGVEHLAFTNFVMVLASQRSTVITNLELKTTYYFAATAVDAFGLESDYSNEVTNTTPIKATPPGQFRVVIDPVEH